MEETNRFLADVHRKLDFLIENPKNKLPFISDWNCRHPFYKSLGKLKVQPKKILTYNYIRGEDNLTKSISNFHFQNGEPRYSMNEILTSNGSTTIISSFFLWLSTKGYKEVYYIPPVYFTTHYFAKIFSIELRPISARHLFEEGITLNLPKKKTVLLLTDPIWYCGHVVNNSYIKKIAQWQKKTNSLLFVDGSFQYFKWDLSKYENTSVFDKSKTFRLICPSKAVATHGLRFSYVLLPESLYDEFDFILDNLLGSSNPYDIEFGNACIKLLRSKKSNNELINYTRKVFSHIQDKNKISTDIHPTSGYFAFAKLNITSKKFQAMDGKYFEQPRYKDYRRINLLGSAINELL